MAPQPLPRIQRDVIREILRQLRAAERAILASILGATDFDRARRLARQRAEIQRSIEVFRAAASAAATGGLDAAWEAAAGVIRQQIGAAASGVAIGGRIDARVLLAMRNFMTNRIADLSRVAIDKINTALAQHLLGMQSLADLVTQVQRILGGEPRRRAMTIAYTEIGRAYSSAQYAQMLEQAKVLPGLKKRWIHSGKEHGRPGHILCADATLADPIPVAEPFEIVNLKTGEVEELRYPRDPEGSAGNTINCGCMMVAVPPEDEEYVPLRQEDVVPAGTVVRNGIVIPPPPPRVPRPEPPDDPRYDGLSVPLVLALSAIERRIADNALERVIALRVDGSEIGAWVGDTARVVIPADLLAQLQGAVVTHNHPLGSGFSVADVMFATGNHLAELRVIAADGLYRLRRPLDAEDWGELAYLWTTPRLRAAYQAFLTDTVADIRTTHPGWTGDQVNRALGDAAMLYFQRTFGVRYTGPLP